MNVQRLLRDSLCPHVAYYLCYFPKRTSLMSRGSSKIDLSLNSLEITGMNKTEGFFSIGFSKVYIVELQRGISLCKVVQNSFTRFFPS